MTAEIVNLDGSSVTKLEAGKLKGINTIEWGFNAMAPKVAKGKGFSLASAPTVKAGKYKVKINKGNEVFEKEIEVKYDPNSSFSLEERTKQQNTVAELFNQIQDLAFLVHKIEQTDEKLEELLKAENNQNKQLIQFNQKLDSLRNKLVVTSGDNYVGAAEPQLKEKFNDIYGTINSYYGAPSSTQLENISSLKNDLNKAKLEFEKLNKDFKKVLDKSFEKNTNVKQPNIQSFEEFLKG
jgi:hypothetical protein